MMNPLLGEPQLRWPESIYDARWLCQFESRFSTGMI